MGYTIAASFVRNDLSKLTAILTEADALRTSVQIEELKRRGWTNKTGHAHRQATGFILPSPGHIMASLRISNDTDSAVVEYSDGSEQTATLIGADGLSGLAMFVTTSRLHMLATAPVPRAGSPVLAQGAQTTGGLIAFHGIIASVDTEQHPLSIAANTSVRPLVNDGPLLDHSGKVVGYIYTKHIESCFVDGAYE